LTRGIPLALACGVLADLLSAAAPAAGAGAAAPSKATVELYQSKCQPCHLADGNSPLPPLNFSDGKWTHGSKPEGVVKVITDGVPTTAMLPFKGQLTAAQIADLAAYVRSFDKSLKDEAKTK
jgi:mono/diheme cytochrome c family protein